MIGTAGNEEKAAQAKAAGADHVLLHKQVDVAKEVRALTGGAGVPVVFDGIGKATWEVSLASTYWGSVTELYEVVALAEAGKIRAHVERYSLDDAAKAYEDMAAGTLHGRAVIVP